MAELGTRPSPPTSPPLIPPAPDPNLVPLNSPPRAVAAPTLTVEEKAALDEEELAAQEQDMIDAKAEEEASNAAMAALEGAFVPNGISRHRGVGPIQYETRRGLIKVFPGDLVCRVVGVTNPDAPEEEWIYEEDWIICSQVILSALLFTVPWRHFPDVLEYRASRIGEERRAAALEVPPEEPIARKTDESDEDFAKRKKAAAEDRRKKILAAQKKKAEERRAKPTQLPAPSKPIAGGPRPTQPLPDREAKR